MDSGGIVTTSPPVITVTPLRRPTYTSTHHVEREQWLRDNDDDLREWYMATAEAAPEEHPCDFREFCDVQWDITRENDERFHDALWEAQTADADAEDEPYVEEAL